MATFISCPHCGKTLQVADGCGGQSTRCPSCLAEFVVPGANVSLAHAAVCPVVAPESGTVTQSDVDRAKLESEQLAVADLELVIQLTRLKRRRDWQARRARMLRLMRDSREALDHSLGRVGGFFIAITIGPAVLVVLATLFLPSALTYLGLIALGIVLSSIVYLPFSFFPEDERLLPLTTAADQRVAETTVLYNQLAAQESTLQTQAKAAQAEYQRLKAAIESRLHWLRTCQWQVMTGKSFEQFLAQVFQERGYEVESTGRTGDQGVDLILVRGGTRVAVQAKGYVGHPVGNAAVQQAFAGGSFHRCQSAAVVTNSRFTPEARALAENVGCRLIDGSQIPDLIDGKILL